MLKTMQFFDFRSECPLFNVHPVKLEDSLYSDCESNLSLKLKKWCIQRSLVIFYKNSYRPWCEPAFSHGTKGC